MCFTFQNIQNKNKVHSSFIPDSEFPDYPWNISKKTVSRDTWKMSKTLTRAGVSPQDIQDIHDDFIQKILLLSSHGKVIKAKTRKALMVVSVFDTLMTLPDNIKYHLMKVFRVSGRHINSMYKTIKIIKGGDVDNT